MPPTHSLPLLEQRRDELSKCAFCPKLCRATCVVSEVEPREALTPWGKMTNAFDGERSGDVSATRAELAWGCSNCFRCREACDHKNPVTQTLNDVRGQYVERGLAPTSVQALLERRGELEVEQQAAALALADEAGVSQRGAHGLLLGCRYAKVFPSEARAAIRLASKLVGPVRLLTGCCGAWQRAAGAPAAAQEARQSLLAELGGRRLLVLDPRCALELPASSPLTLVELAARHMARFERPAAARQVRYHDSCALGRGLGLYDEPRRLLSRVTGGAPQELEDRRELSRCSGGGGILPVSMPQIAEAAGLRLAAQHAELGGGTLVTSCASSLSQMLKAGVDAVDLITLLEGSLSPARPVADSIRHPSSRAPAEDD